MSGEHIAHDEFSETQIANRLTRVDVRTMAVAEAHCGNQDIDGDGSHGGGGLLFLTASQLTMEQSYGHR